MPPCAQCEAPDAPSFSDGWIIDGGYGRFDMARLVWLDRGAAVHGPICDDCLEILISEGAVEIFDEPGMFEDGRRPSPDAYRALFLAGASRIRHIFHELNGARFYAGRPLGEEGRRAIIELRAQLSGDDTFSEVAHAEHQSPGELALRVGECHAISAISLGYGEEDPGFVDAAIAWTGKRVEMDQIIDLHRQSLIGPIM